MVEKDNPELSVVRQAELLGIHRSGLYYKPCQEDPFNLDLMRIIDEQYLDKPFYGISRMTEHLKSMGYLINIKRVRRLYRLMGLHAIFPSPKTTWADKKHKKFPYLLRGLAIVRPNQVWACDITYIPMKHGFMYLVAIIDLYSRFVVNWGISNSLEADFCVDVLKEAIKRHGKPEIFNTDQGVQFTCLEFIEVLENNGIRISMDGKGRAIDNVFIERLWRSVKYENVYLHAYTDGLVYYSPISRPLESIC